MLEHMHDAGADLHSLTPDELSEALTAHGLSHHRFLRQIPVTETLPWDVLNSVDPAAEESLLNALKARESHQPVDARDSHHVVRSA